MKINLPVRFYRSVPTSNPEGHVEELWELDIEKTAFIELHCWNIGCSGGIAVPEDYWVFVGCPQNHVNMWRIVTKEIAPAICAARSIAMPVVHVQGESIARRYPQLQPPAPQPVILPESPAPVSDHLSRRQNRVHGEGFMEWDKWQELDVAEPVKPEDGDVVVVTTQQFDTWLRSRNISTLIYTGFSTNLCILDSPAAIKAMASLGYRCVILREGTLAVEFTDTLETLSHTENAIRYIEAWWGYSASVRDFTAACEAATVDHSLISSGSAV